MNLKHYSQVFIIQYQLNVTCNVHQQRKRNGTKALLYNSSFTFKHVYYDQTMNYHKECITIKFFIEDLSMFNIYHYSQEIRNRILQYVYKRSVEIFSNIACTVMFITCSNVSKQHANITVSISLVGMALELHILMQVYASVYS